MDENPIQSPPPVQPPTPIKPTFKFTLVILPVLGLAIAGYFASAYYFTLWPFEMTIEPVPTFTPRPSSAIKVEDTSNWKTYTSQEYGFEVKYPNRFITENIKARDIGPGNLVAGITIANNDNWFLNGCNDYPDPDNDPRSCNNHYEINIVVYNESAWTHMGFVEPENIESVTINGIEFIKHGLGFYYKNNNQIYYNISYDMGNSPNQTVLEEAKIVFNQILGTFKFIK